MREKPREKQIKTQLNIKQKKNIKFMFGLAMQPVRVNKQNLKVNLKNIFIMF